MNNDDLYAADDGDEEDPAAVKKGEGKFFDSNYLDEEKSNESNKASVANEEIDDFEPTKNLESKKKNRVQEDDDEEAEEDESVVENDDEETDEKPNAFNKLKQQPAENDDNENEGFFEEEAALSGKY